MAKVDLSRGVPPFLPCNRDIVYAEVMWWGGVREVTDEKRHQLSLKTESPSKAASSG